MEQKHRKQILERKERAAYYKAVRIYSDYTVRMNDVLVVRKMIRDHNISEKNITKAIITYNGTCGKNHAKRCIYEARKGIYKGIQQDYSPFLKLACERIVFWKDIDIINKMEVGAADKLL